MHASSKTDLIVLDFAGLAYVKHALLTALIQSLLERDPRPCVVCVNVRRDVETALKSSTALITELQRQHSLWPLLDEIGRVSWLGLGNPALTARLTNFYTTGSLPIQDAEEELGAHLNANPSLFNLDETSGVYLLSLDFLHTLAEMRNRIQSSLLSKIDLKGIRATGHFKLPSGSHCGSVFQASLILNDPRLLEKVASSVAWRLARLQVDVLLVPTLLAIAVGKLVIDRWLPALRLVEAFGYPDPLPRSSDAVREKERVVLLLDILNSGASASNLQQYVIDRGACVSVVLSVVDIQGAADRFGYDALIRYSESVHVPGDQCPGCIKRLPLADIDPFTSMPHEPTQPEQVSRSLLPSEAFWDIVLRNHALKEGHFSYHDHHFSMFVETHRVFRDRRACSQILECLFADVGHPVDAIVYPAHPGAIDFAHAAPAIQQAMFRGAVFPVLVPATRMIEGHYDVSSAYLAYLRQKEILIVDDGANFGETMTALFLAVNNQQPSRVECAVLIDRLAPYYRRRLAALLATGNTQLRSLFCLPFPVYYKRYCPLCRENRRLSRSRRSGLDAAVATYLDEEVRQLTLEFIESEPLLIESNR